MKKVIESINNSSNESNLIIRCTCIGGRGNDIGESSVEIITNVNSLVDGLKKKLMKDDELTSDEVNDMYLDELFDHVGYSESYFDEEDNTYNDDQDCEYEIEMFMLTSDELVKFKSELVQEY